MIFFIFLSYGYYGVLLHRNAMLLLPKLLMVVAA